MQRIKKTQDLGLEIQLSGGMHVYHDQSSICQDNHEGRKDKVDKLKLSNTCIHYKAIVLR
jgi:hypothetical protein